MRPTNSAGAAAGSPKAWVPPALTKLSIGSETRSAPERAAAASGPASTDPKDPPKPPAAPSTKLGFALEWAFPLSARIGND